MLRNFHHSRLSADSANRSAICLTIAQAQRWPPRLRTAIRRYHAPETPAELPITVGELTLDPGHRTVQKSGAELHLTPLEFDTLMVLMSHAGHPVSHARLHGALGLAGDFANRGHLRVLIGQLRKKLGDSSVNPTYIVTDGYVGYRFRDAAFPRE